MSTVSSFVKVILSSLTLRCNVVASFLSILLGRHAYGPPRCVFSPCVALLNVVLSLGIGSELGPM